MSDSLPAPLIEGDVDLRDYTYMPLYGARLFGSDTWIEADSDAKVAALRLWWASWHQEPAGSLPDNDRLLADMAGYGVALSAFSKVKPAAMRGWIKCSDGRLYHPVVCEIAADVWRTKRRKAAENAAERERKARKRGQRPANRPTEAPAVSGHVSGGKPPVVRPDGGAENALKGKEEEERDNPPVVPPAGGPPPASADPADTGADGEEPPGLLEPIPLPLDRTEAGDVVQAWNAMVERVNAEHGRPVFGLVQKLTQARRRAIAARLKDVGGLEGMKLAFERVAASPRLRGEQNGRGHEGWRANFDFILQDRTFTKLMEGEYDDRQDPGRSAEFRNGFAALLAAAHARAGQGDDAGPEDALRH